MVKRGYRYLVGSHQQMHIEEAPWQPNAVTLKTEKVGESPSNLFRLTFIMYPTQYRRTTDNFLSPDTRKTD